MLDAISIIIISLFSSLVYPSLLSQPSPPCRYLPSDPLWPSQTAWEHLNQSISRKMIRGVPLAQPCYAPHPDIKKCVQIQESWLFQSAFETDPVNIMSPYWLNNSCSPFLGSNTSSICALGNLASFALNVSSASDVIAALKFARESNIRLTIKNTGHDFLGRSTGAGSLALWMHNLKDINFLNYSSSLYTGPAVHIGAGVQYADLYPLAQKHGYRAVGGSCSGVGLAGGYTQGGGHGPLIGAYGVAADQVLEWEVVTATGQHLLVSPTHHADLYWALSGGGGGNFAVVLSMKVRVYDDGPVAGAAFSFENANSTAYWIAVGAWLQTLLQMDAIEDLTTVSTITAERFLLNFALLPDVTTTAIIDTALKPFFNRLEDLDITLDNGYAAEVHVNFAESYDHWVSQAETSNTSIGGRNIPRSTVQDNATLPALISAFHDITDEGGTIFLTAANITHGNYTPNAVLPTWRDALFAVAFLKPLAENAELHDIRNTQAQLNSWQEKLRAVTPGGGSYANEATWNNPYWKYDYYGSNYKSLLEVKKKYDPEFLFWANAAVGSDLYWKLDGNGALCRI
ncbi:FAD binding domain-containing protein [Botrytis cinerea]